MTAKSANLKRLLDEILGEENFIDSYCGRNVDDVWA